MRTMAGMRPACGELHVLVTGDAPCGQELDTVKGRVFCHGPLESSSGNPLAGHRSESLQVFAISLGPQFIEQVPPQAGKLGRHFGPHGLQSSLQRLVSLLGSETPGLIGSAEHLLKRLESPLAFLMPRPLTTASLCANAAELPL